MAVTGPRNRGLAGIFVCLVFGILLASLDVGWLRGMVGTLLSFEDSEDIDQKANTPIEEGN